MMSKIKIRHERFSVDYQKQNLHELFSQQASDCDFTSSPVLGVVEKDYLVSVTNKARQTLLVASEQIKDDDLIQALKQKADGGVRIYLLLGDKQKNQKAIDTLSGRCLIRTGVTQLGALVLVDHITIAPKGLLLMGQEALNTEKNQNWAIELEPQQIDDSFRSFCKLFWEHSDEEYIKQNQSQGAVNNPDGSVVTNHSHHLKGSLKDCLHESLSHLDAASSDNFEIEGDSHRLLLASNAHNISQLARPGVALTDQHIPTLLMSSDGNWLLPDRPDFNSVNWCLKLSDEQSVRVASTFNVAMEEASWQYQQEMTMGDLSDNQSVRFADQPGLVRTVEQTRNYTLDAINTATIDHFINDSPQTLASEKIGWQRDSMGHQINYQVTIHPPYCSAQAKKDTLYSDWESAEESWQKQLSVLTEKQKKIDKSQEGISDRFKGFVKAFLLGQGQSSKKINQQLNNLQQWSVTEATPAERIEYQKRLEALHHNIMDRGQETARTIDQAEQNYQWTEKQKKLLDELEKSKKLLSNTKDNQSQLLNEKEQREKSADKEFYDAWTKSVNSISDKQVAEVSVNDIKHTLFLPEKMPEKESEREEILALAQSTCTNEKRKFLADMTTEQAKQWKSTIKEKTFRKYYSELNRAIVNHDQAAKKIQRDCDEAKAKVKTAQEVVDQAQSNFDMHGSHFVYKESNANKAFEEQLGLKAKASNLPEFTWPNEELPAEGTELRKLNGQRYLVIFDLENLDTYREDAKRLNAKIVCDKESVGA